MSGDGTVFGIDLGTTFSCLARVSPAGEAEIVPLLDGSMTLPSVVLFVGPDDYITGETARQLSRSRPDDVCSLVKRKMGEGDWRFVPAAAPPGMAWSAPAISGLILSALVSDAELTGGEPVRDVVITVPAYFGDEERRATVLAGEYAGLNVVDVINEPTAAALSYGFARFEVGNRRTLAGPSAADEEVALVYDLGGGTFDVTIVELADRRVSVVAIDGDHQLGGADWDEKLVLHLASAFTAAHPSLPDPLDDGEATQALALIAERARRELTDQTATTARVEHAGAALDVELTRAELERLTSGLLDRTVTLTNAAVEAARARGVRGVDRVLLVGGASRMPAIARRLSEEFDVPVELSDPDLAVARGAALYGEKKALERLVINDLVTRGQLPDGAGVDAADPSDLEAACRRLAEALGLPAPRVRRTVEVQVVNVISRGFGVLALDRFGDHGAVFLVHRNDRLPVIVRRPFGTVRDDQDTVTVYVVEQAGGTESRRIEDNKIIAAAEITDIPPGYSAGTEIEITFRMGFDGMLEVTARHEGLADQPLTVRVETSAALSQADVAREREQVARARRARDAGRAAQPGEKPGDGPPKPGPGFRGGGLGDPPTGWT
ncbi:MULTISPECIES: Hsp70 family protein [unclassified Pseudofrankia]|uniref:Hsp70 family protein n=1 Tax=unclassified Pseudofrankia TaxID=2994372 RepID=UPI0008DB220D|nr:MULTISPECIES: Hsp70 family protein [unclassified Pseudofrankia]MDT3443120.1 Hsp70 family protein [Pseudofrankia sp. BMG5.37]OHV49965.1 heat-shock protein Hsp70 [Pseudofrankia sp. BMG5.36]